MQDTDRAPLDKVSGRLNLPYRHMLLFFVPILPKVTRYAESRGSNISNRMKETCDLRSLSMVAALWNITDIIRYLKKITPPAIAANSSQPGLFSKKIISATPDAKNKSLVSVSKASFMRIPNL